MGLLGFRLESDLIDRRELKIDREIAVFTGMNATFKSLVVRTLAGCGNDQPFKPTLHDISGVKVEYLPEHEACNIKMEKYLIEDNRLVLRKLLGFLRDNYEHVKNIINSLKGFHDERLEPLLSELEYSVDKMFRAVGLDFVNNLIGLKSKALLPMTFRLYSFMNEIASKIREELKSEIEETAIMPLEFYVKSLWDVDVIDRRFKITIPMNTSSTSIIAPMLFEFVTAFLSVPESRLLIIEEPEESMTPLQQVVFAKYLESAVGYVNSEWVDKKAYVLVTTHSPYISMSFTEKVPIYYFGFEKGKIIIEEKPLKTFVLGDSVLGVRIGR